MGLIQHRGSVMTRPVFSMVNLVPYLELPSVSQPQQTAQREEYIPRRECVGWLIRSFRHSRIRQTMTCHSPVLSISHVSCSHVKHVTHLVVCSGKDCIYKRQRFRNVAASVSGGCLFSMSTPFHTLDRQAATSEPRPSSSTSRHHGQEYHPLEQDHHRLPTE